MSRRDLTPNQINNLRTAGQITGQEVAYFHGDLLIVENVVTNEKRVLENHNLINESGRRILKG
tara:strand:- start:178 stop:366 length:189 start_codon:yes stop_codon:yes gene_type:complete